MSKLLNNLPIEDLTKQNDYLGIIDKGDIIKTFLESNTDEFKDIKMFSLYGEWGSGKSTLMKYLQKELKDDFNTFFFEAWQYESDDNLSLSLLEYLTYKTSDSTEEAFDEIVKVASKLFRGFSKSIRITVPGLSVDGNKIVESLEEDPEESFYQLKSKFETEFIRWESNITKGENPKFNIVFIDDLDRCEPENVLNLLSALKLFFTYGEKTIFFCGIDKKAVKEAVKNKYGDNVKANEYLEKIFDISFSMPNHDNILKLISQYFSTTNVHAIGGKLNTNISQFFNKLNFNNPRRVKKVLNKYLILSSLKKDLHLNHKFGRYIPNIYIENEGNFFETILTLYLIILHEFYQDKFERVFDLKFKESMLTNAIKNSASNNNYSHFYDTISEYLNQNPVDKNLNQIDLNNSGNFETLIFSFLPNDIIELGTNNYSIHGFQKMKFKQISLEYRFLEYVLMHTDITERKDLFSSISLLQIKNVIKDIL